MWWDGRGGWDASPCTHTRPTAVVTCTHTRAWVEGVRNERRNRSYATRHSQSDATLSIHMLRGRTWGLPFRFGAGTRANYTTVRTKWYIQQTHSACTDESLVRVYRWGPWPRVQTRPLPPQQQWPPGFLHLQGISMNLYSPLESWMGPTPDHYPLFHGTSDITFQLAFSISNRIRNLRKSMLYSFFGTCKKE